MRLLKNKLQLFILVLFLAYAIWAAIQFPTIASISTSTANFWKNWANYYFTLAIIGCIIGFVAATKWGGFKTTLGKALMFFALGLFGQVFGQLAYDYYSDISKIAIPYPSLGDVGYFGSILSYACAAFFLAKTAGVGLSLKRPFYRIVMIAIPLLLLSVSSYILLHNHQFDTHRPITVFLDAGYPVVEAIYISIAVVAYLLSRKLLGGILKPAILFIIVALAIQYAADFTFVYQANDNTWVAGGVDDFLYLVAYTTMSLALLRFRNLSASSRATYVEDAGIAQEHGPDAEPVFNDIAVKIIEQQENIMGSIAIERARQVKELNLDWSSHTVRVVGNPQSAINKLVDEYKMLLGNIAAESCKDASAGVVAQIPPDQVPASLR